MVAQLVSSRMRGSTNRDTQWITTDPNIENLVNARVAKFINSEGRSWIENEIPHITSVDKSHNILKVTISILICSDKFRWPYTRDRRVSIRYPYRWIRSTQFWHLLGVEKYRWTLWIEMWKNRTPPKVNTFMWRLLRNSLVVKANLTWWGIDMTPDCPICDNMETRKHTLIQCQWAKQVWFRTLGVRTKLLDSSTFEEWMLDRRT